MRAKLAGWNSAHLSFMRAALFCWTMFTYDSCAFGSLGKKVLLIIHTNKTGLLKQCKHIIHARCTLLWSYFYSSFMRAALPLLEAMLTHHLYAMRSLMEMVSTHHSCKLNWLVETMYTYHSRALHSLVEHCWLIIYARNNPLLKLCLFTVHKYDTLVEPKFTHYSCWLHSRVEQCVQAIVCDNVNLGHTDNDANNVSKLTDSERTWKTN